MTQNSDLKTAVAAALATAQTSINAAIDRIVPGSSPAPSPSPAPAPTPTPAPSPGGTPVPLASISVNLTLKDGTVHTFNGANAIDLGDYTYKTFFTQRNAYVTDPAIPMTVFFRPDTTTGRVEVVFEWGSGFYMPDGVTPWTPSTLVYRADVLVNGVVVHTENVAHFWCARWRWQSAPRQVVNSAASLKAAKKVLPFAPIPGHNSAIPPAAAPYVTMGFSSATTFMGTSGEGWDLGILNEYAACYLATGDATALASTMIYGEIASTCYWHIRDPKTMKPISFFDHPHANFYVADNRPGISTPPMLTTYRITRPDPNGENPVTVDTQHMTAGMSYVPFLLTGDLYHLEELQFCSNWSFGESPYSVQSQITQYSSGRGFSWSLRAHIYAVMGMEDAAPTTGSLLPVSYFQTLLNTNRDYLLKNYVNNPSPVASVLFMRPYDGQGSPVYFVSWQHEYFEMVCASVVLFGMTDWQPIYNHAIQNLKARVNGKSGFPRTQFTGYAWTISKPDGTLCSAWVDFAANNSLVDTTDGHVPATISVDYMSYARTALSIDVNMFGNPESTADLAWVANELYVTRAWHVEWRWSL